MNMIDGCCGITVPVSSGNLHSNIRVVFYCCKVNIFGVTQLAIVQELNHGVIVHTANNNFYRITRVNIYPMNMPDNGIKIRPIHLVRFCTIGCNFRIRTRINIHYAIELS